MHNITKLLISILTFGYTVMGSHNNLAFAINVDSSDEEGGNEIDLSPLSQAVLKNNPQRINLLLERKADLDAKDCLGNTPLMYAALSGKTKLVNTLIQAKAAVNSQNLHDETALTWAAKHTKGHDVITQLLAAKANPNLQDSGKCTALMHATWNGKAHVVDLLLRAKADSTLQDSIGYTALMYAIRSKHKNFEIVRSLVKDAAGMYYAHIKCIVETAQKFPVEICKLIAEFDDPFNIKANTGESLYTLSFERFPEAGDFIMTVRQGIDRLF